MRKVLLVVAVTLFMGTLVASNGYAASPCSANPSPNVTNACTPCNQIPPTHAVRGCLEDDQSGQNLGCIGGNVVDPNTQKVVTGCVTVGPQSVCSDGAGNITPCDAAACAAAADAGCRQDALN